jgi:hypothetical protein
MIPRLTKKQIILAACLIGAVIIAGVATITSQAKGLVAPTPTPSATPATVKSLSTLTNALPYRTNDYSIDYAANADGTFDVYITPFSHYDDTNPASRDAEFRQHIKAATDYVTTHGGDLSKLNLIVDPDPDANSVD